MTPLVSVIMGSTSDLPIMQKATDALNRLEIPFEVMALSAHRTPDEVAHFAQNAAGRGVKVIIAAAGMAAHLPGVIASMTTLPVIGVPVATVGINAAQNAALLAAQIIAQSDEKVAAKVAQDKQDLKNKIVKANNDLKSLCQYEYRVN